MAKASSKKSTKKAKRHYPVQRQIRLGDQTAANNLGRFMQASKLLSFANRRLYRQSNVYSMKIDVDINSAAATAGVDVYVLRDTWDLHGAYKLAMKNYYNAIKEELQMANGANTRWHDFRVQPDFIADELVPATYHPNQSSPTFVIDKLTTGDHDFSEVVDAAGAQKTFVLDDIATSTQLSIIAEWQHRDRTDTDPADVAGFMPYRGLVENLDQDQYAVLRENGRVPPYNDESDTGLYHKVTTLQRVAPDGTLKLSTGFFDAPLGIVLLVSSAFDQVVTDDRGITVTFQAGDYKGVKATSYATPVLTEAMEYEVV